ncbi:MAG: nickel pincer cofactor biosynthesis protein LarC, partial [Herpetosiphonaceae bacterium]|nr:nickel pincer cofactor biosynthesis protein LarC [Herpetosiphonaceae bacterium]
LVDAGLSVDLLTRELTRLGVAGWQLRSEQVQRAALRATHLVVEVDSSVRLEHQAEVEEVFARSTLPDTIKADSLRIFERLFAAEARVHGATLDEVHLHEMGSLDTLVDIVGAVIGLHALGIEAVYVSPLPMSRGTVRTQHGLMPLPAPAVLELLRDTPVRAVDIEAELVTPTGAAILTTLAQGFNRHPSFTISTTGYGAGSRDLPFANVLRVIAGETVSTSGVAVEQVTLLETQIDDMPPEWYGHVMNLCFQTGALDVYLTPVQMKKNRPGTLLTVITRPERAEQLRMIMLTQTTTLGVRQQQIERFCLPREIVTVTTRFGPIQAKVALLPDGKRRLAPEYEACRQVAEQQQVPLWEVYQAVHTASEAGS